MRGMNAIEKAIREAFDGGFPHTGCKFDYYHSDYNDVGWYDEEGYFLHERAELIFSKPLFWKALGKEKGWEDITKYSQNHWKKEWHRFIDHLGDGKSAESFFETL